MTGTGPTTRAQGAPVVTAGRVLAVLLLAATYLLTLASFDPLDIAVAIVLSAAVLAWMRGMVRPASRTLGAAALVRRALGFPRFALAVIWEITVGTWRVALVVAGVRPLVQPGIVAVPVGERSQSGVAASALALTLSPGEVFVDVDWERGVMLIHVLDARDPDAVREHHERFYERFQKGVFP